MTDPTIPIEELYPYTEADLERVKPSEVRAGDLIAHAGPPGAHRYVGDPVTLAGWAGYRTSWKEDVYRVEYTSRYGPGCFEQPDRMTVYRVKADRRHDRPTP